jgi:hypothetical protein
VPAARLFDLEHDPLELINLADDPAYADVSADLHGRLWGHLERVHDPILRGPVPSPFYLKAITDYRNWSSSAGTGPTVG